MKKLLIAAFAISAILSYSPPLMTETAKDSTKGSISEDLLEKWGKGMVEAEKRAIATSIAWLALVDNRKYTESWEDADEELQNEISKRLWIIYLENKRGRFGKPKSRKLINTDCVLGFESFLTGEPVRCIFQYSTSFKRNKSATETITLIPDEEDKWKVYNYIVK